jgi:ABC-type sulfate/molybdate transport systems ATPase subunit
MTLLSVAGICKQSDTGFVLKDISFTQKKLQRIAIAGETGSGKSTLLKIIAGLQQPDTGVVEFEGEKVVGPADKLVPGHPHIAYLSQHFELAKFLRVEQVLSYANILTDKEAEMIYQVCKIEHLLKRKTDQLSGGEKQRIALAKLLIASPRLLLLDEPYSNLDMVHKNILKSVIRNVCDRLKITCILISHDPADTLSWANKIIVMKDGVVIQQGVPEKIYLHPVNEYVASLFGKYTLLNQEQVKAFKLKDSNQENSIFIRPENFEIVKKAKDAIKGKIKEVIFFGGYFEIEVEAMGNLFTIRTDTDHYTKGDSVNVSLSVNK